MLGGLAHRLRAVIREGLFQVRKAQSRLPLSVAGPSIDDQLVVVIPSYHEDRARNLDTIVRAALQCTFVARVIVSNHNPKGGPAGIRPSLRLRPRLDGCC
jgi:hypothetical protein